MLLFLGAVYSIAVFAVNAFLTIPFSSWLARRLGAIDQPGEHKIHAQPTPRLGGVGIVMGFILAVTSLLVPLLPTLSGIFETPDISTLLDSQLIICFSLLLGIATVGILDDIYNQKAWVKFILEGIIATILILTLGGLQFGWLFAIIAWFAIVGLINGYNFLDGIDGLAASVAVVHLMTLAAMFVIASNQLLAIVAMTLALATLGFLRYNWPPASIFMGDTGSLSLGFVISALSLTLVIQEFTAKAVLAVILAASLPLGDLSLTFLRRLVNGQPLFGADRGHYYDQMNITAGISKVDTMRLSILVALSLGILSAIAFAVPISFAIYPLTCGALLLILATRYFKISLQ